MLLRRFQVFLLVLLFVTVIHHLFKNSPIVVKRDSVRDFPSVRPLPPLRPVIHMRPLHVIIGPPTKYEHDMTALYAFSPIHTHNAYRRRSSTRSL